MKLEKALWILAGEVARRLESLTFQDAIKILAHYQITGDRDAAARRVAQDLTTQDNDKDGLVQWVYNGDYDGSETVASLQSELSEVENQ